MKHFDFIVSELTEKEYYATRSAYLPKAGETLMNHGGFPVTVLNAEVNGWHDGRAFAVVVNPRSGWVCEAHGIGKYIDGRIDWDGSIGVGFLPELQRVGRIVKNVDGVLSLVEDPLKRQKEQIARYIERDNMGECRYISRKYYKDGAAGVLFFCQDRGFGIEDYWKETYFTRKDGSVQCIISTGARVKYHGVTSLEDTMETDSDGFPEDFDEIPDSLLYEIEGGMYSDWDYPTRRDRDEWDDLWDDRARSVGAVRF